MKQFTQEQLEDEIKSIICEFEKIKTLTKILNQTLIENFDFNKSDSLNVNNLLSKEVELFDQKLIQFKNNFKQSKISCR